MLSVITPSRNMGRYLERTLDSVASLEVPHEHLVMDGESDDGTVELLRARKEPALSWVSEPDRGQTHAVNKGLERARGELIAWLNADDEYVPDAVDRAVAHLSRNPATMATFGGIEFVDENGTPFRTHLPGAFHWRRHLYLHTYLPTPTIIFRRELLAQAPALDEAYADAADYDFYLRLFRRARVDVMPEVLVRFRYHPQSKSASDVWTQHDEALQIRLGWARNGLDRAVMKGYEGLKRAILPRISNWPQPQPSRITRLLGRAK